MTSHHTPAQLSQEVKVAEGHADSSFRKTTEFEIHNFLIAMYAEAPSCVHASKKQCDFKVNITNRSED